MSCAHVPLRVVFCCAAFAILALLLVTPARADEVLPDPATPEALAQLKEGNKRYQLREYEKAIAAYKEGVRLEPKTTITFWYNLGQAHRQWGRYEDAIWFYSQFLKTAPAKLTLHRRAAEDFITKMRAELDRAASTAGPTEPGPTPFPRPDAASGAAASLPSGDARLVAPTRAALAPHWYQDRMGWILTGVGVAVVVTGAGFLVNARSLEDQANREPLSSERMRLRDDSSSRRTIGAVAAGAGLAVLGAGVIKLVLTPNTPTRRESFQVAVAPHWIAIQGRF